MLRDWKEDRGGGGRMEAELIPGALNCCSAMATFRLVAIGMKTLRCSTIIPH